MKRTFSVIGGDRRQAELVKLLEADGHTVLSYGLKQWIPNCVDDLRTAAVGEIVLLPLPLCREPGVLNCAETRVLLSELLGCLRPEQLVLAGQVRDEEYRQAAGLSLRDYFQREELAVANAAATAEAAIRVAMQNMERTLLGMDCLVLGYGRIGKLLCCRLHGMGARVFAAARKAEDRAWIRAYGYEPMKPADLDGRLKGFGAVFNTIPAHILGEDLLKQLPQKCVCVELASVPGIDLTAAEALGLPNIWARALPGRCAPETAAEAIRGAVYNIIYGE